MSQGGGAREELEPAEERLRRHLARLREDAPRSGRALTERVIGTARWQRAVRGPLQVIGLVATAAVDGLALLAGRRGRRRRP